MEYKNYDALLITSSKLPQNTHLWFELDSGMLYMVEKENLPISSAIKMYYSNDKANSWTQLDIDPNNDSVDNKSRLKRITAAWHDRTNKIIYFVDSHNNGTDDEFDVWKLDYSSSETAPTVTDIGTSTGADANSVYAYDIFMLGGSHVYVVNKESRSGTAYFVLWEVESAPFTQSDLVGATNYTGAEHGSVSGSNHYFVVEETSVNRIWIVNSYAGSIGYLALTNDTFNYSLPPANQRGVAVDSGNNLYFILTKDSDSKEYLAVYDSTTQKINIRGEYNIALMLNRNTKTSEKAFHIIKYNVYQLHPQAYQIYMIADLSTISDAVFVAITDNFLMNNDGDMFEFVDKTKYIFNLEIAHEIQEFPTATFGVLKTKIIISKNMFMSIKDFYRTAGSTTTATIIEGKVVDFDEQRLQKVWLESPAGKELELTPSGDYSGRSDQIISSLISTYCKYITIGTLGTGTAMGTVTFAGDKTLKTILDDLAKFENWIWYLTPEGVLYFNNASTDSGVDIDETDPVWNLNEGHAREKYNYFYMEGAFVSGVQLFKELEEADDLLSQQLIGFNPLKELYSELNTQTIVNTMATNRKARMKLVPLLVEFWYYSSTIGMIQPGETITFQYNKSEHNISSDQFLINGVNYKLLDKTGGYTISDELI